MTEQHRASVRRWGTAALAGLISAALIFLVLGWLPIGDTGLSAFFAVGLGLCVALAVARWYAGAVLAASMLEVALSALVAILSIIAAVVTAFA
jgi:hypothetical protein